MNAIRLTFAIEMIDDIIDGGGDVTLSAAFNKALGTTNGPVVYKKVLAKIPQFSASTTRLQVSQKCSSFLRLEMLTPFSGL
jgi:hypothetical protein